jgi:hypothetical protein
MIRPGDLVRLDPDISPGRYIGVRPWTVAAGSTWDRCTGTLQHHQACLAIALVEHPRAWACRWWLVLGPECTGWVPEKWLSMCD